MSGRWTPGTGLVLLGMMALSGLAGCQRHADPSADGGLLESPEDWPSFGRTAGEQHYSPLDQIDRDTVHRLSLAWYHDLEPGNTVTAPVSAGGKLFVTTGHSHIRAFDGGDRQAALGVRFENARARGLHPALRLRAQGPRLLERPVFIATHDGHVVALDAEDGKLLWEQTTIEPGDGRYVNGPPRVFDGKVDHRTRRRRFRSGARLCRRLRCHDRKEALALLHGARQSGGRLRERCHGDGGHDLERRVVAHRRRRHGLERHQLRPRARLCLSRHRERLSLQSPAAQRGRGRQSLPVRRSSRSMPIPASTSGTTRRIPPSSRTTTPRWT